MVCGLCMFPRGARDGRNDRSASTADEFTAFRFDRTPVEDIEHGFPTSMSTTWPARSSGNGFTETALSRLTRQWKRLGLPCTFPHPQNDGALAAAARRRFERLLLHALMMKTEKVIEYTECKENPIPL